MAGWNGPPAKPHLISWSFKILLLQVIELRERRLDHEETLSEVQKATDEHKRNLDRQVRKFRMAKIGRVS